MFNPVPHMQNRYALDPATAKSIFKSRLRTWRIFVPCGVAAGVLAGGAAAAATALNLGPIGSGIGTFLALMTAMALSHRLVLRSVADAARSCRCLRCHYSLRELPDYKGRRICPECGLENRSPPADARINRA